MPRTRPLHSRRFPVLVLAMLLISAKAIAGPTLQPITPDDLRPHIRILASDAFEGRAAGGPAQAKTIHYIAQQMRKAGLQPGASGGRWYQPVDIVHRVPEDAISFWRIDGKRMDIAPDAIALNGGTGTASIHDGGLVFVGYGLEERGYHNLEGADLRRKVALLLAIPPKRELDSDFDLTLRNITDRGAAAVIQIYPQTIPFLGKTISYPWKNLRQGWLGGSYGVGQAAKPSTTGAMPYPTARALMQAAGLDLDKMVAAAEQKSFHAAPVNASLNAEVRTKVSRLRTYNVIGRLPGRSRTAETIAMTAHWDGLGYCRPEGNPDRICNGAADNASGVAAMIEIARRMARGSRPDRNVLFIATGGEELGTLGAKAYVAHPTVPLKRLVAALNLDMLAPARPNQPLGVVGAGKTPIDPVIETVAKQLGRSISTDSTANDYISFTDTGPFLKDRVAAVSVQSLYGDTETLKAFEATHYHQPSDEYSDDLELRGAAEDATFNLVLARRLADRYYYRAPRRNTN
jgi:Zn-dependent M28 family amino/carboxypeptidase